MVCRNGFVWRIFGGKIEGRRGGCGDIGLGELMGGEMVEYVLGNSTGNIQ